MPCELNKAAISSASILPLTLACLCALVVTGCQEIETVKREVLKKINSKLVKTKKPFTPRDGITVQPAPFYRSANPNSEVIRSLPAETPLHLVDKVGEWYRARTRDGREGYISEKIVGGEDIIRITHDLRRSIEGMPVQAEGVIKNKANFRLSPGRHQPVVDLLPAGRKFEMYERVVTARQNSSPGNSATTRGGQDEEFSAGEPRSAGSQSEDELSKKDVWYKVKIEDGRVGYVYTHNLTFTPPEDLARQVPYMRLLAWRPVGATDDPDLGAKSDYLTAFAPMGRDPGSDYTHLYLFVWSKMKRREIAWRMTVHGVLPITDFKYEGSPGFSIRYLHPTKSDKLVLASFAYSKGRVRKVSEEEIPDPKRAH